MRGSERRRAGGWPCCPDPLQLPPQDHHGSSGSWHAAPPSPRGSPEPPSTSPGAAASALSPHAGTWHQHGHAHLQPAPLQRGFSPQREPEGAAGGGGGCVWGENWAAKGKAEPLGTPRLPSAHQSSPWHTKVPLGSPRFPSPGTAPGGWWGPGSQPTEPPPWLCPIPAAFSPTIEAPSPWCSLLPGEPSPCVGQDPALPSSGLSRRGGAVAAARTLGWHGGH